MFGGLFGKALGAARELLSAAVFGTGAVASAYRVSQAAFLIPLNGFVSDTLNAALIPRIAQLKGTQPKEAQAAYFAVHHSVLIAALAVTAILLLGAAQWVSVLAPDFQPATAHMAADMVRVMACALVPYVLFGVYASVELAHGSGVLVAARASVQSLGLIAGTVAAWYLGQALWIAIGFAAAQWWLGVQGFIAVRRRGYATWRPCHVDWPLVRQELSRVGRKLRVLVWIPLLMQVHFVVERRTASFFSDGTVAALDYAKYVSETLVYLAAMPFGVAGLSAMAGLKGERFRQAAAHSNELLLLIGVPASIALGMHAELLVALIYQRGAFNAESAALTTEILRPILLTLWAQMLLYAGYKFLSSQGRNGTVLLVTAAGVTLNIAVNLWAAPHFGPAVLGASVAIHTAAMAPVLLWTSGSVPSLKTLAYWAVASAMYVGLWSLDEGLRPWRTDIGVAAPVAATYWGLTLAFCPQTWVLLRRLRGKLLTDQS